MTSTVSMPSATAHRKAEGEAGAALGFRRQLDEAAVGFDDRPADGEAHAARLRPVATLERLEDAVGLVLGHARAFVAHRHDHLSIVLACGHPHGGSRR